MIVQQEFRVRRVDEAIQRSYEYLLHTLFSFRVRHWVLEDLKPAWRRVADLVMKWKH